MQETHQNFMSKLIFSPLRHLTAIKKCSPAFLSLLGGETILFHTKSSERIKCALKLENLSALILKFKSKPYVRGVLGEFNLALSPCT